MSQASTNILFPQTTYNGASTITGEAKTAASYYLGNRNIQTVSWSLTSFNGILLIQATLVENPSGTDWITVYNVTDGKSLPLTENSFTNVEGNFVWIRAQVNQYVSGIIRNVKVSF